MLSSQRRLITGLLFISPWLAGFLLLVAYPFAASFFWSFCRYDLLTAPRPIGTDHYQRLADELLRGGQFGQAVWNTAYYALISVPLSIVLAILLAVMLSWKVRGQALYRTVFFLPSVVPVVAASVLWMWLLDPDRGLVNHVLSKLGLPVQNLTWFTGPTEAFAPPGWLDFGSKDALILMSLWGVGNFMIIYLAALGEVPRQLHEAAALDGAGRWQRFRHVTLPLLTPIVFFNLIMGLIQSVQAFTQVYIVSEGTGAPAGASMLISLRLFLTAFLDLEMGYASAMSWLLLVVLLLATWGLFRSSRHWVHYAGGGH